MGYTATDSKQGFVSTMATTGENQIKEPGLTKQDGAASTEELSE